MLIHGINSKIFPPTPEDLPKNEEPTEAEVTTAKPSTEEVSTVSNDAINEPHAKKLKASTEDLAKDDWETVEKPNEAILDQEADLSEEGEKVEAVDLDGSDGEKVEKPVAEQNKETRASVGIDQPKNMLAKDW